jgi:hypothetical protein
MTLVDTSGQPLRAGDIKVGSVVEFDRLTGTVTKIIEPEAP